MSLRSFVDSAGNEWHAYDVVPRTEERRRAERRSVEARFQRDMERRHGERRVTVGRVTRLSSGERGWLCFECRGERRRLSPIPDDWNRCSDGSLEAYCRAARPARLLTSRAETESAAATPRR